MAGFGVSRQAEIDTFIQDQTTGAFHRYFMTEDKDDITLAASAAKDATVLTVSSGHGFDTDDHMLINYGNYYQQTKVMAVSGDNITIESPLGLALPIAGVEVIRGSIEMNVDGSETPVDFYCRPGTNSDPIDVQHLHVFMKDSTDGSTATYGGEAALTNGTFARYENGVDQNLGLYKKNGDFVQFGAVATYNEKAPTDKFNADFAFDLKDTYGIVFRLAPSSNSLIKVSVRDDLTGLDQHRIVATGQITLGEA